MKFNIGDKVRIKDVKAIEECWPKFPSGTPYGHSFKDFYKGTPGNIEDWYSDMGNEYFCGLEGTIISNQTRTFAETVPNRNNPLLYEIKFHPRDVPPAIISMLLFWEGEIELIDPMVNPISDTVVEFNPELL